MFGNPTKKVARWLESSECLIIMSGAGMGVDSGLPDFRGEKGFWKNYPICGEGKMNYMDAANAEHFETDPEFGWGFNGHRLQLYRDTDPHAGFGILRNWIDRFDLRWFSVTSNVDGHFQKAGFDPQRIYEVHGSVHHLQCLKMCRTDVWENHDSIAIDPKTFRALDMPRCPHCGALARPNVQFFADYAWSTSRCNEQRERFNEFWREIDGKQTLVIEIGAGRAVPNIRVFTGTLGQRDKVLVTRINPTDPQVMKPHVGIQKGGLEAIRAINEQLPN